MCDICVSEYLMSYIHKLFMYWL